MKNKILIIFLFIGIQTFGQDIHFTQYQILSNYFNPAQTGNFNHSYLISGIHRNQWRNVSKPYSTFGIAAEKAQFKKLKGLGLGVFALSDVAGSSNFTTQQIAFNLAYHIALFDSSHQLSIGFSPQFVQQSVNLSNLAFGNQYNNGFYDPNLPNGEINNNLAGNAFNFSVGGLYSITLNSAHKISFGGALINMLNPEVIEGQPNSFQPKLNAHIQYQYQLSRKWYLMPNGFFSKQHNHTETLTGANLKWMLKNTRFNQQALVFGAYYRWQDAWAGLIGFHYQNWYFAMAYDVNTSGFNTATNYRGAYEFAVTYFIDIFNESHQKFKNCPTFL